MNTSGTQDWAAVGQPSRAVDSMLFAILVLVGLQLLGEILRSALNLPLPGPVIGMFILMGMLLCRPGNAALEEDAAPSALTRTATALIANMGLLFVPAGVGILAEIDLLRANWLPIIAGVVGSTLLSLIVTGFVMQRFASAPNDRGDVK